MRKAKMGGGMMRKDTMMKKGGKIPPQLKKYVMAKKKIETVLSLYHA